ncbi:hypothetical protein BGZ63DRAFT_415690 [Mariannaea sp. PMI_226]|nr:hypothetical protein BGZ63DRAFT_415690 [Mariannaea sp. PMI_226]
MMSEPDQADPSLSALAFAVYFAAVTSLDEGQVSALSPDNRQALLYRFKTGLNQAITDANLLNQPDVMVLQAVAIFATCLRVHDISRSVWILIGTAIRLAQSIGIHRDGASLKLSPFETELRLRLWWQLCSLDARAPEDHGFAVTIENFDQGLRFPRDINDDQLFPAMKALPPDATTWTEATYFLVQIEAFKVLNEVLGPKSTKHADAKLDLIAKRQALETHNAWMNSRYFALEPSSSIQNAAYTHYKTVCAKIEFMILVREELHLHSSHETASIKAPPRGLGRTPFLAAYRNLVSSYSLIGGEASNNFKWLFQTYAQWYALAYSLRYLGAFPTAPEADQAWDIINRTFDKIPYSQKLPSSMSQTGPGRSSIWGCLELLRFQASAARMNVLSSSNTEISAGKTQNKRPEFDNIDYHGNVEQGNPSSSSSIASHQTLTQPISLSHVPAMEFSHMHDMIDQSSDREEGWQNGLFPFSRSALSEMLYLPGWCDVVNIGSDMTE